jgi:subtilisin
MIPAARLVTVVAVALALLLLPGAGANGQVIPGQFIVELKPGVDRDAFIRLHGVGPIFRYNLIHGFAARLPAPLLQRLQADARVAAVSPDLVVSVFDKPAGPRRVAPSATTATDVFVPEAQTGVRRIGADVAAAQGFTGTDVKVAVIDTGIDCQHPDLQPNCHGGVNLLNPALSPADDHGHGTHVAGILAATGANDFGVQGVAPQAWLYAVKVLDAKGSGALSTVIQGLNWAASNGVRIANVSLGGFDFWLGNNAICTAIANAVSGGMTVVAAAGNSKFDALYFTPANCRYSLTVSAFADFDGADGGLVTPAGASEMDDTFAQTFSNYSTYCHDVDRDYKCTGVDKYVVDLMAPGVDIVSTMPTYPVTLNAAPSNKSLYYDKLSGTSMATPHVSGAAALLVGIDPTATPEQLRRALRNHGACIGGAFDATSGRCPMRRTDDPDNAWEPLLSVGSLPWP